MKGKRQDPTIVEKMRREWDQRAQENARHYVATGKTEWSDEDFFKSGQDHVEQFILPDIKDICARVRASEMHILEIGCGAGRMTEPLSRLFGHVDAVDISSEMVARARTALAARENVQFHVNNGFDLSMLPDNSFDFAFSVIVFQHIPRKSVVENYIRETWRVLRSNSLFKFQLQGYPIAERHADTWVGVGFSEADIADCAARCGFQIKKTEGAGTQDFWITLLKP
ncbi:MAG TPA: class I SAM-dependent methyltransferase [Terriglobia bacterium]|nr:class I SAM-dependent methyltransferase [Terriglobia bacterium]